VSAQDISLQSIDPCGRLGYLSLDNPGAFLFYLVTVKKLLRKELTGY